MEMEAFRFLSKVWVRTLYYKEQRDGFPPKTYCFSFCCCWVVRWLAGLSPLSSVRVRGFLDSNQRRNLVKQGWAWVYAKSWVTPESRGQPWKGPACYEMFYKFKMCSLVLFKMKSDTEALDKWLKTEGKSEEGHVQWDSGRKENLNIPHVKYGASVPGTSQEQFRCKTSGAKRGNLLYSATITASSTVFTSGYLS